MDKGLLMTGPRYSTVGGSVAGDLYDDAGNLLLGSSLTALTGGLGPALRRYIMSGVYNGDFYLTPRSANSTITTENPLPFWTWTVVSGTAVTATSIADTGNGSGRALRLSIASGAASDEAYIEQIVPVNSSRNQAYTYRGLAYFYNPVGDPVLEVELRHQFLKVDGVTPTGASVSHALPFNQLPSDLRTAGNTIATPTDAYFIRLRVGLNRDVAADSAVGSVDLSEVRIEGGPTTYFVTDDTSPATNLPSFLRQTGGALQISPSIYTALNKYVEMAELTAPAAGAANTARFYVEDNGAGKTRLVVKFNTGAAIVIATQP